MHLCAFGIFKLAAVQAHLASCAIGLNPKASHHFGIPVIPSWATSIFAPSLDGPSRGFWARITSFYITLLEQVAMHGPMTASYQPIFDTVTNAQFPPMAEVMSNISLVFVNSNEFFDLPHLTSNKVVYIGGLLDSKAGKLSAREEQILANSKAGVILFSFGTLADTNKMPSAMKSAFIKAFAQFPTHDFIWKLSVDDTSDDGHGLSTSASNVHTMHWVQQKALLQHPKLKAFITHCGLNSLNEAAAAGVPVICIPLFGDQPYNAAIMRYKQMGVYLDIRQAVEIESITSALKEVLNNRIYADNARLLARKLAASPFSAAEKFVKWVEFAADYYDLNELNLPYSELNFFVYYSLDVITVSLAVFLAIGWLIQALLRFVVASLAAKAYGRRHESTDAQQRRTKIKAT